MTANTCQAHYPLAPDRHPIHCAQARGHDGPHESAPKGWNDYATFSFADQPDCWDVAA